MGHERVGFLPKSKSWIKVVESIHDFTTDKTDVSVIAKQTLKNVRQRFLALNEDASFLASFKCLVLLSYANKAESPFTFLRSQGINISSTAGVFQLTAATQKWMEQQGGSKEYSGIATKALIDTINGWVKKNQSGFNLFGGNESVLAAWETASNGSGFCELSRDYLSRFTTNYLYYFLDRAASAQITSLNERRLFTQAVQKHTAEISTHAFETSKIAQSFAAGWFNKNAKIELPTDRKIKGFLGIVTKKMHDEFSKEERGTKS